MLCYVGNENVLLHMQKELSHFICVYRHYMAFVKRMKKSLSGFFKPTLTLHNKCGVDGTYVT